MNDTKSQSIFDIDFKDLALLLLKRIWLLILAFAICFGFIYYTRELPKRPLYTAVATMYVSNSNETKYYYSTSDTYNSQNLIKVCSVVMRTDAVASLVRDELKEQDEKYANISLAAISGSINVTSIEETEVMRITCTTGDPQMSADICNAILSIVPDVLTERIKVGTAEPLDTAVVPMGSTNHPSFRTPALYGFMGAAVVAVIIVLAYLLDTRIKSKEEITNQYGIPILSEIPNFNIKSKERYNMYYEYK